MLDDMLALANSVYLLALSRSGRHVLALLLCAGLIALAVLRLRSMLDDNIIYILKQGPEKQSLGKEGSNFKRE